MSDHLSLIGLLIICSMGFVFYTTTKSLNHFRLSVSQSNPNENVNGLLAYL